MPPKTKFSKEEIINVAFEIACEAGFSKITARNVAARLNASVAPIYLNFNNIEELIQAVVEKIFTMTEKLLANQTGESYFEKIGMASIEFARLYPVLFREVVLTPNPYLPAYEKSQEKMIEALAEDEKTGSLSLEERKRLFFKLQIFQTGLTALIANGHIPASMSKKDVEELLLETGEEFLELLLLKRKEQEG